MSEVESDHSKRLEQSLDAIIATGPSSRPPRRSNGVSKNTKSGRGRHPRNDRVSFRPPPKNREAERLSEGKAYLRVRNLHPELSEQDIFDLFSKVGEVKFCLIQFGTNGSSTGTAFVGFVNPEDSRLAIEQFDGRKAAGQIISVENAVDLASRISVGAKKRGKREPKPKDHKKSIEELDAELQNYMGGQVQAEKESETVEPSQPFAAVNTGDGMSLD
ncbi:unnamed protein product [Kuraishia capsulata CBS 1993]|uniref:RRM domain-containing protein n=1 Tax=Kuraishia capsulata CBS 1993 TaxID=1382522 RepID=W6MKV8_9ASCO|nr:uncharacterized protein KUCA_T00003096001 [Kuraishia capsulata CBS 1993]CDK27119.1 unnamed protein product [Kuraishia capsulata CBS 1993]